MKIYKIKSVVLDAALKTKEFGSLEMYLMYFGRTEDGCFISQWNNRCDEVDLKSAIKDYCSNEQESEKIWDLAEKVIGKRKIDLNTINVVDL